MKSGRPVPPPDLRHRELPLSTLDPNRILYRIHGAERGPLFFGPKGRRPHSRFDDPAGHYKVCYLGENLEAAFVETLLRTPAGRLIAWSDVESRYLAAVDVREALLAVDLVGPALRRLGATAEVPSTRDYSLSQAWSRSLWEHPVNADGIRYRCRHDDSVLAVALFNRARTKIRPRASVPLAQERDLLDQLSDRYGFGLVF